MKKFVSALLAVCLSVSVFFSLAIAGGANLASADYTSELWLIDGVPVALVNGERVELAEGSAPYTYMGNSLTAYLPLSALVLYTGATYKVSDSTVTVSRDDGHVVVATDGSTAWSFDGKASASEFALPVVFDGGEVYLSIATALAIFNEGSTKTLTRFMNKNIGLVVLSYGSIPYTESFSSLDVQIENLRHLLYEYPTGDEIYADIEAHSGVGTHPNLFVNQERFNYLSSLYKNGVEEGGDSTLYAWINSYTTNVEKTFRNYFFVDEDGVVQWAEGKEEGLRHPFYIYDENGNRLVGVSTYTYTDSESGEEITLTPGGSNKGDGYDAGGRLEAGLPIAYAMRDLAFGWQITGEQKYADAVYLVGKQLGTWQHWGEGHFLNCADMSVNFAMGLDWVWHAFDNDTAKRDELCTYLYELGVMKGYYSLDYQNKSISRDKTNYTIEGTTLHYSALTTGSWKIANRTNNWQTVCGSGMISASLVLLGTSAERDEICKSVMSDCLANTYKCVLQYAPDGSFIESPGYWTYATETFLRTVSVFEMAAGTDYGYLDTVGLQDSFYFANYICNYEFRAWDYHDGSWSAIRTGSGFMYMASKLFDDPNIARFRDNMFKSFNCHVTLFDVLYYDPALAEGADEDLSLDYYGKAIETVTMRDGWEAGATFTGLHVGANNVSHGDIDSGNFYLHMGGILWVGDEGSENYNVGSYFSNSKRYYYYKKSAEAHNTVVMRESPNYSTDFKYGGQVFNSQSQTHATFTTFKSYDELGAVAIANMKPQYGSNCTSGQRGIMMTNSRGTVVLQDQISFDSEVSLTWVMNVTNFADISPNGKTAYASIYSDGELKKLRMTLISDNESLRFERSGLTTLLPNTITKENSGNEKASSPDNRLIINADNVTEFNVAVVFELIKHEDEVVGYEYVDMSEWEPVSDEWVKDANADIDYEGKNNFDKTEYTYTVADLVGAMSKIERAKTTPERMQAIFNAYLRTTSIDKTNATVIAKIAELQPYLAEYNEYVRSLNSTYTEDVAECVMGKSASDE
ncbi:MAG: heparinase II/III family protein [Clostridia bacterium]|nr:heparinase II/III family protein [Clostridia bacterium]